MKLSARETVWADVRESHERYLREMGCQVVHASLHGRAGWAREFVLECGGRAVGHGSLLVDGPWAGTRTVFEFFVESEARAETFRLFSALVQEGGATHVEAQTNDRWLAAMLLTCGREVEAEKLLFADEVTTEFAARGAVFRGARPEDAARVFAHELEPVGDYVLEVDEEIAATGGVMYHYNPPYGDVFMEVAPKFRRRGLGTYLVQELKRVCRKAGKVPCARCDLDNVASRQTCLRAGFLPVGCVVRARIE